jgi:RNA polymerase sigma-70 factor (ECF subfamily)
MEEKILINGLKKRDKNSFEEFVNLYKDRIYNITIGLIQNAEDAEDLTQEVFLEVFNSIKDFKQITRAYQKKKQKEEIRIYDVYFFR